MGSIVIEELKAVGGPGSVDSAPIANLRTYIVTTSDSTTTTSPENIMLDNQTRFIRVHGVENHRVSILDPTVNEGYGFVPAGTTQDYAVRGGETIYYRLDA